MKSKQVNRFHSNAFIKPIVHQQKLTGSYFVATYARKICIINMNGDSISQGTNNSYKCTFQNILQFAVDVIQIIQIKLIIDTHSTEM